eukprot:NODE_3637_length_942_cov_89.180291_g3340_i0.p1 GENE.NODE_3637_length_942_cov_89.180291_g3340_i0~~NODE_3637_length_942_cov_89.180291_g3340_i0.p1  ORF type:complete len:209 (+),score=41.80 NODE_3637_length_942_cov_89.180291_g3340_i0:92-718(+)
MSSTPETPVTVESTPAAPEAETTPASVPVVTTSEASAPLTLEEAERPAKRQKPSYALNLNLALDKAHETKRLKEIIELPPSALQGLSEKADSLLKALKITTIGELGSWSFYQLARAIVDLADKEEDGKRHVDAEMNINKALVQDWETKPLKALVDAPVSALQRLAPWVDSHLAPAGIKTVGDLGRWKYAQWAEALVTLSSYESADHSS